MKEKRTGKMTWKINSYRHRCNTAGTTMQCQANHNGSQIHKVWATGMCDVKQSIVQCTPRGTEYTDDSMLSKPLLWYAQRQRAPSRSRSSSTVSWAIQRLMTCHARRPLYQGRCKRLMKFHALSLQTHERCKRLMKAHALLHRVH